MTLTRITRKAGDIGGPRGNMLTLGGSVYLPLLFVSPLILWPFRRLWRSEFVAGVTGAARSALQTLHKVSSKAREQNYFLGGLSHDWVSYYEQRIESDRSCLNEWHAMDNLESRRPPSPDSVRTKPRERDETERVIRSTLKEIMMSVDLDEVTSKYIRGRLEEDLDMDLGEFKPFIDQEMLTILGQMDAPTEIFDHVYLGSEWNASNLEELQKNGVRHILNVTREIDNFFPGMFTYLNVRVYDDEKTDLLKHWDDTFKYITKAKKEGSKVLVHCKMGVSRSASVVIAYAMKAYNWDFSQAWKHVKEKRNCIKPNNSFLLQLETYQGILDAMKNKEKLQRSKSDTNLKSPASVKDRSKKKEEGEEEEEEEEEKSDNVDNRLQTVSGSELKKTGQRPKSWSPDVKISESMLPSVPLSQSLESIDKTSSTEAVTREALLRSSGEKAAVPQEARNVLMPCGNGQSYSVSQNQIVHLPGPSPDIPSVKNRISKLETQRQGHQRRKGLVLNLTNQFEAVGSKPSSPSSDTDTRPLPAQSPTANNSLENGLAVDRIRGSDSSTVSVEAKADEEEEEEEEEEQEEEDEEVVVVWGSGQEKATKRTECSGGGNGGNSDSLVWTGSMSRCCNDSCNNGGSSKTNGEVTSAATKARKDGDPFSTQVDRVFDREERHGEPVPRDSPSRQSSWSSYDSAVVLENSVHSSWATLPSRNSSWGSYDMRPSELLGSSGLFPYDKEEIPWHPGTVKRTKQKLEESTGTGTGAGSMAGSVKRVCCAQQTSSDPGEEESFNPVLLQHDSPIPRRRDSSPGQETQSNPNPSPNANAKMEPVRRSSPSPTIRAIDITPPSAVRQVGRLSTSAPAPSSLSPDSDLPSSLRSCRSESETSSPCVVNTTQCPSVKHHKMVLENLSNKPLFSKRCLSVDDSPDADCTRAASTGAAASSGIVKNLKKEFEAKSSSGRSGERSPENSGSFENEPVNRPRRDAKIRSLPSSPVIPHNESKIQPPSETKDREGGKPESAQEDRSVRVLVGRYEVKPETRTARSFTESVQLRKEKDWESSLEPSQGGKIGRSAATATTPEYGSRRSAPVLMNHASPPLFGETAPEAPGRPPVPSAGLATPGGRKQQQQHGRTHPLARLQVRPRHSSPVYNTM